MMPRFSAKALLIAVTAVALWLATFSIPELPQSDVGHQIRAAMILAVWLLAGSAALYYRGKRQAFWLGFFAMMALVWAQSGLFVKPSFSSVAESIISAVAPSASLSNAPVRCIHGTLSTCFTLAASALVGLGVAVVYEQSRSQN